MKPAAFEYVRPKSVAEAIAVLSQEHGDAQVLAVSRSCKPARMHPITCRWALA
jgi:CO/xanthine dehydrogenase FAD-binding subunit